MLAALSPSLETRGADVIGDADRLRDDRQARIHRG